MSRLAVLRKNRHPAKGVWSSVVLCATLCSAPVQAEPLIPAFSAYYNLHKGVIHFGETVRSLKANGDGTYLYESLTKPTAVFALLLRGNIIERSLWKEHNGGIRPLEYSYLRSHGSKERDVTLYFDWAKLQVTNTINEDPWQMPIPEDALDKLVYQLSLMQELKQGKRKFEYNIADGGRLKTYTLAVVGEQDLDTILGKLHTVMVRREGDKRGTTMWCADRLNFLPVRIEQTETDGSEFSAELTAVHGLPVYTPEIKAGTTPPAATSAPVPALPLGSVTDQD